MPEPYRVYAIKYAEREARRRDHFIGGDPHDAPMDMDYFIWALVRPGRVWVVDTGFDVADAAERQRRLVRTVRDGLALVGVDSHAVEDVIVTHLHYDHIGGHGHFPKARFHLQDREMAYATGRHMTRPAISHAYTARHIADLVHHVFARRVVFHDGEAVLEDGLSLHHVGGHTMGLQVVRVWTEIGWIVLASDASHYYENMQADRPYVIVWNQGEMLEAFRTLERLADDPDWIVPGHDPLVLQRYPAPSPELQGKVARLDVRPLPMPKP
ncbi:MAG: N-acyl homoserine lactonase family protein [Pseudomonadota bacterium]|nr:N-acyl homoserine lactonase family protein [Pseudomonadota bacterium]